MAGLRRKSRVPLEILLGEVRAEDHNEPLYGLVDPLHLYVFEQPRRTFDEIGSFANGLAVRQINPILVARFTSRKAFARYVLALNRMWKRRYQPSRMAPNDRADGKPVFQVLISGERRVRAFRHLATVGCDVCRESENGSTCFERHYPHGLVRAQFRVDIDPMEVFYLQNIENTHRLPPEHESARAYQRLYLLVRSIDPNYPLATFAHGMGRTPETMRRAFRFIGLPEKMQEHVAAGDLGYGIACEIARLQPFVNEPELFEVEVAVIASRTRLPDFRASVTRRIIALASGQGELLGGDVETARLERLAARRLTVHRAYGRELDAGIAYMVRILRLTLHGELGGVNSPYANGSIRKKLRRFIELQRLSLQHCRFLYRRRDVVDLTAMLDEEETLLNALDLAAAAQTT